MMPLPKMKMGVRKFQRQKRWAVRRLGSLSLGQRQVMWVARRPLVGVRVYTDMCECSEAKINVMLAVGPESSDYRVARALEPGYVQWALEV
ncbi:hypothetical protein NDU88_005578 [Pleurodeles waltl]|uniref:Uncharacterized protein n=1 Tax=Pleurodeles waltl TaxID=8319 RepID=A0AAV7MAW3_PLEWA|nr:hypothetical protein NDU88_005578 [Pleurodeles waltl]